MVFLQECGKEERNILIFMFVIGTEDVVSINYRKEDS